jgi:hypothetical protein
VFYPQDLATDAGFLADVLFGIGEGGAFGWGLGLLGWGR